MQVDVRQQWREDSQDSGPVFFLLESLDGAVLPEEGSLEDVVPRKGTLAIHIIRGLETKVRVFGTQSDPKTVRLLPMETTRDLTERIMRGL